MTAEELRKKYIQFFVEKGHQEIPSGSLVPEHDPTALFINSGMHPLVPYLLGQPHPLGKRLTSVQKCVRTDDINEVGDNTHLTFFEMLGNWSLGDYFKKDAINWSFEFLTDPKWLGLDPKRLYVSVFSGDKDMNLGLDEESVKIWQEVFNKVGIKAELGNYSLEQLDYSDRHSEVVINDNARIFPYPREKNWWGPAGQTGPCGPDTEMFYDTGKPHDKNFGEVCHPNCSCGRFVEIWNDVFMQFEKKADASYVELKQQNVDTGLGLERETMILQGRSSVFETELFANTIAKIEEISGKLHSQSSYRRGIRIIADHLRTATFIISDGVIPANKEQGSILRRLIRRAIRFARLLGIEELFTAQIAQVIISDYQKVYSELKQNQKKICQTLSSEEDKFAKTLDKGLKEWQKIIATKVTEISGEQAFYLYESFGFPIEITEELAQDINIKVDVNSFQEEFNKHQIQSRVGAQQKFAGGLADHGEQTTKLHTATHLLQAALRQILGNQVQQAGSNITSVRLRFDFTYNGKITDSDLKKAEELVNQKIKENLAVTMNIFTYQEALKDGALAFFGHKYPEKVKVYTINGFSKEICGGPHMDFTASLGSFKIIKAEKIAADCQRIYATIGK